MTTPNPWRRRFVAAGLHLTACALVAALASLLVFRLWYPPPYSTLAGGFGLFALVVGVDIVLGPLLTFVAASPGKSRRELTMDLCLIAIVQLAALGYGVYTMAQARPVHLAFEVDRFRVVTAADFEAPSLAEAPAALRELPWTGPTLIAALKPLDPQEQLRAIDLGLAGFDLSMVPRYWAEYAPNAGAAWAKARPVDLLTTKYPEVAAKLADHAAAAGRPVNELRFLPVTSRQASWVALLADGGARVVGFLPVDGFF
jgi:hypothetical protein